MRLFGILLVAYLAVELLLLGAVAWRFGGVLLFTLLLGTGVIGFSAISGRLTDGKAEASRRVAHFLAGVFLLLPGILGDLLGFAILFPPTRALLALLLMKWIGRGRQNAATPFDGVTVKIWEWSTDQNFPGWEAVGQPSRPMLEDQTIPEAPPDEKPH